MNKNIMKTLVAGLACLTLCTTACAAPGRGGRTPQKAPTHHVTKAKPVHAPAPAHHKTHVVHHAHHPTPAPHHHHTPPPPPCHPCHHAGTGLVTLGATVIGGVVGGILGACL